MNHVIDQKLTSSDASQWLVTTSALVLGKAKILRSYEIVNNIGQCIFISGWKSDYTIQIWLVLIRKSQMYIIQAY